jgi:hypothetical protein
MAQVSPGTAIRLISRKSNVSQVQTTVKFWFPDYVHRARPLHVRQQLLDVPGAGIESDSATAKSQLIDSNKREKRSNRSFRRLEVHGWYTGNQFLSCEIFGNSLARDFASSSAQLASL